MCCEAGPASRGPLEHALGAFAGPLAIVRFWDPVDPLGAARVGHPGAGAELLHAVHADNQRARAEAERDAAAGVALAQEAGREAVAVVHREDGVAGRDEVLRELVRRHEAVHLVLAASSRSRSRWRRLLSGPGPVERLAADPPCPCTIVPAGAARAS